MRFIRNFDLETMCLYVIASNIETFITNTHIPEKQIEFLHRVYAHRLYQLMENKVTIEERHILWFFTPYLKQVTLGALNAHRDAVLKRLQTVGSAITSLNFTYYRAPEAMIMTLIGCIPNVKRLILRGTGCSDRVLLGLRMLCPCIVTLDINGCFDVTDNGMKNLCSESNSKLSLTNLDISNTRVKKMGVCVILNSMPQLSLLRHGELSVILYQLHKSGVLNFSQYNLKEMIHFSTDDVSLLNILEVWTEVCPNVSCLIIDDVITDALMQLISKFTHLKDVRFVPFPNHIPTVSKTILPFLTIKGEMLTTLYIFNMPFNVQPLVRLCRNLRHVFLENVVYEDFSERDLNMDIYRLRNMETIVATRLDFSQHSTLKAISFLISLSGNLRKLYIKYAKNFSEKLTQVILNSSPRLFAVDFSFTDIELPSLMPFFNRETVKRIFVDSCKNVPFHNPQFQTFKKITYDNTCAWHPWDAHHVCDESYDVVKFIYNPGILSMEY